MTKITPISRISRMSRSNFDLGLIPHPKPLLTNSEEGFSIEVSHTISNPGLCKPISKDIIATSMIEVKLDPSQKWNWWNDIRSSKIQISMDNIVIIKLDRDIFLKNFIIIE